MNTRQRVHLQSFPPPATHPGVVVVPHATQALATTVDAQRGHADLGIEEGQALHEEFRAQALRLQLQEGFELQAP